MSNWKMVKVSLGRMGNEWIEVKEWDCEDNRDMILKRLLYCLDGEDWDSLGKLWNEYVFGLLNDLRKYDDFNEWENYERFNIEGSFDSGVMVLDLGNDFMWIGFDWDRFGCEVESWERRKGIFEEFLEKEYC